MSKNDYYEKIFNKNIQQNNNLKHFLENLSVYIDEPIFIYGSILRPDYNIKSDIDVCVFTNNINSLMLKLQHFLSVNKQNFKKIFWRLPNTKRLAIGNKIFYENKENNLLVEISLYDKKYKQEILNEHYSKTILPFYATFLLFIIKYLHYDLSILNRKNYAYLKKNILSVGIGKKKDEFFVL